MPLEGIRVVDLTIFWAGPLPTAIMADFGAEVIKVEAANRFDPFRVLVTPGDPSKVFELSACFNSTNRNKLGLTLDLTNAEGRRLFIELVRKSDVLVQNFSPRVMPQLGLDYETLRKINPALVMTSVSGFGQDGPWRDYVSFAAIGEALSGITGLTGYTGEGALCHGVGVSDPFAGYMAAFATIAAVMRARETGRGQHVDCSQLESSIQYIADAIMDFSLNGRVLTRGTNDDPALAPHGCFPARGDDQWLTLSVGNVEQWHALVETMGHPAWASEERFATPLMRHRNREVLNALVAQWTARHDKFELTKNLQSRGVPAAPALMPSEQLKDPQLSATGYYQSVDHRFAGRHPYQSLPVRFDGAYPPIRRVGPTLGQDNREVLTRILGLGDAEIARLEAAEIIGTQPTGKV
ncbi:MAG: CaiB/BaiF CoA transferase family protein [Candidatus Binataceae bacterium]